MKRAPRPRTYGYDTLRLLIVVWMLANRNGHNVRVYDKPRTPYQRVIDSGVLTATKTAELKALFDAVNPAHLTRDIIAIQTKLIHLAAAKTNAISAGVSRAKPSEARTQLSRAS